MTRWGRETWRKGLLDALEALPRNQLVEDRQDLLAVNVRPVQLLLHSKFVLVPAKQLIVELLRNVDIAPQCIRGMPSEEQAIEQGGFPLRSKRVEVLHDHVGREGASCGAIHFRHKTEVSHA